MSSSLQPPPIQNSKQLYRPVVGCHDASTGRQFFIFSDTDLGREAKSIVDKNEKKAFCIKHGMFGGECANLTPRQIEERKRRDDYLLEVEVKARVKMGKK